MKIWQKPNKMKGDYPMDTIEDRPTIKLDWLFFLCLPIMWLGFTEFHEQAHITTGYFICDGYGGRNLNVWGLPDGCKDGWWPTWMGPVFTIGVGWIAALMLFLPSRKLKALAIGLFIFSSPMYRFLQVTVFSGGDEAWALYHQIKFAGDDGWQMAVYTAMAITFAGGLIPTLILWWKLNRPFAWLWTFLIVFVAPVPATLVFAGAMQIHTYTQANDILTSPGLFGGDMFLGIYAIAIMLLTLICLPIYMRPAK